MSPEWLQAAKLCGLDVKADDETEEGGRLFEFAANLAHNCGRSAVLHPLHRQQWLTDRPSWFVNTLKEHSRQQQLDRSAHAFLVRQQIEKTKTLATALLAHISDTNLTPSAVLRLFPSGPRAWPAKPRHGNSIRRSRWDSWNVLLDELDALVVNADTALDCEGFPSQAPGGATRRSGRRTADLYDCRWLLPLFLETFSQSLHLMEGGPIDYEWKKETAFTAVKGWHGKRPKTRLTKFLAIMLPHATSRTLQDAVRAVRKDCPNDWFDIKTWLPSR